LPHAEPYASVNSDPVEARREHDSKRNNFLALVFCLMIGTAALPHVLMRYYTTTSVASARDSVFWSLFFIAALYVTAPALAVLVKFDIYSLIVGKSFTDLPSWVAAWQKVDPKLLSIVDTNHDGVVQLAEIVIGQDIVVLATPEIAGLPYVVSGLVAAGGLAAALSTADGLLLTIANAFAHDLYYKMINPSASAQRRITMSKVILLAAAITAAAVAAQKPADILFLVSAAFSLAASAFFVPLVAGIFWKRANRWGAIAAMTGGVGVTSYYMITTQPWLREIFHVSGSVADHTWLGIAPISAGVFGVAVAFVLMIAVSLLTPAPGPESSTFIDSLRYPGSRPNRTAASPPEDQ
jgi:cation/acetate symporter